MLTQHPALYAIGPEDALAVGIVVSLAGALINRKVRFLSENYIPPAVTGGLICSLIVSAVRDLANAFEAVIQCSEPFKCFTSPSIDD